MRSNRAHPFLHGLMLASRTTWCASHFENLCKITQSTVSRTTIQTILLEGVKLGYLKKFIDKKDKRKKYYSCEALSPALEKWHNQQQKIFN